MTMNRGVPGWRRSATARGSVRPWRVRSWLMVGAVVVLTGVGGCWNCGQKQRSPWSQQNNQASANTGNSTPPGYRNLPGGNVAGNPQPGQGSTAGAQAWQTPPDSKWGNVPASNSNPTGSGNPGTSGSVGAGLGAAPQNQPTYNVSTPNAPGSQDKFGPATPEPTLPPSGLTQTHYSGTPPFGTQTQSSVAPEQPPSPPDTGAVPPAPPLLPPPQRSTVLPELPTGNSSMTSPGSSAAPLPALPRTPGSGASATIPEPPPPIPGSKGLPSPSLPPN